MQKHILVSFKIVGLSLALLWLFQATTAEAKIYKWRDDSGKLHFTDNASKIPKKYRDNLEKFKGAPPPPAVQGADDGEEPGEGSEGSPFGKDESGDAKAGTTTAQDQAGDKSASPPSKYTKEEATLMTAVYKKLLMLWGAHIRLMKETELKKSNYKQYVRIAKKSYEDKKKIIKEIGKSEIALLQEVRTFLKKTIGRDRRMKEDSDDLEEDVKTYYKRLMREIPMERELLESFNQELDLKAEPLDTLEDEMAAGEKRRETARRQKSNKRKKEGADHMRGSK